MSSYAEVYAQSKKGGKALLIYDGSRNSKFYEVVDDAGVPYGRPVELDSKLMEELRSTVNSEISRYKDNIKEEKNLLNYYQNMANINSDVIEQINNRFEQIAYYEEEIADYEYVLSVLNVLETTKMYNDLYIGIDYSMNGEEDE